MSIDALRCQQADEMTRGTNRRIPCCRASKDFKTTTPSTKGRFSASASLAVPCEFSDKKECLLCCFCEKKHWRKLVVGSEKSKIGTFKICGLLIQAQTNTVDPFEGPEPDGDYLQSFLLNVPSRMVEMEAKPQAPRAKVAGLLRPTNSDISAFDLHAGNCSCCEHVINPGETRPDEKVLSLTKAVGTSCFSLQMISWVRFRWSFFFSVFLKGTFPLF